VTEETHTKSDRNEHRIAVDVESKTKAGVTGSEDGVSERVCDRERALYKRREHQGMRIETKPYCREKPRDWTA